MFDIKYEQNMIILINFVVSWIVLVMLMTINNDETIENKKIFNILIILMGVISLWDGIYMVKESFGKEIKEFGKK
jgi:spore maturation protein SpmA